MNKVLLAAFISIACLYLSACSPSVPETPHAKPYTVFKTDDAGFLGRSRYQYNILAPSASNSEEFAQTAMKAAIDLQQKSHADVVYVFIDPSVGVSGTGDAYAIARYAPDGGGNSGEQGWTWQVEAAKKRLTDQEIAIIEMWFTSRDQFQANGYTDEPALKEYIAGELNLPTSDFHLPMVIRSDYEVQF